MEEGFLNRSTKPKTKKKDIGDSSIKAAQLLTDLAKKVHNIEGKMVGKDDKPLKPYRTSKTDEGTVETSGTVVTSVLGGTTREASSQAIQRKIVKVATLMNEEKVQGAHVALPLAAVNEISAKFDHTLYGYFIGSWLAFPIVKNYVCNAWAKYGLESTIVRDGFFLFKFSSNEGLIKVLDKGPWFIRSRPLMLHTWSTNTKMKKEECTRIPMRVLVRCVLIRGVLKHMQGCLVNYAVEWSYGLPLLFAVLSKCGTGADSLENLDVEYEWRPSRCSKCNIFGHDDAFCPSKDNRVASNSLTWNGSSSKLGNSQGEAKTTHPNQEGTNSTGDQSSESLMADIENIHSDNRKSKFIQDDINLGDLRNTMDKLMEEDKDAKKQENGSLWERFKEVKMASTTDLDSEVEEVYSHDYHKSNYIASASGEFTLEDDDLDCNDGYEAQLYDLSDEMLKFCDHYDVRLKSRVK
ncbi:zinc knuckle CX2CX4HX4C containing protein [Tanacetum coccineum]